MSVSEAPAGSGGRLYAGPRVRVRRAERGMLPERGRLSRMPGRQHRQGGREDGTG